MSEQSPLDRLRDALDDYHGYVASDPTEPDKPAYAALAQVQTLVDAAHHYLNGTDPDGYINLREALAPFAGDGNEWAT